MQYLVVVEEGPPRLVRRSRSSRLCCRSGDTRRVAENSFPKPLSFTLKV